MIDDKKLAICLQAFAFARDWDLFHTPKNLASALAVESRNCSRSFIGHEVKRDGLTSSSRTFELRHRRSLQDILLCLIRFVDKAGIDLQQAAELKIEINAQKYSSGKI